MTQLPNETPQVSAIPRPVAPFSHGKSPPKKRYIDFLLALIGHLLGTAVIFVSFFIICWAVSWLLHFVHSVHPFPNEIFVVITKFELGVVYTDMFLCAFLLLGGAFRLIKEGMD